MKLGSRVRSMEKRAQAAGAELCRCSMPILAFNAQGVQRVFAGLDEYYDGTVQGEPLEPPPLRPDRTPEPIPERCGTCGRLIDYVRVQVG